MGFEKEVLQAGSGAAPTKGKEVTVHCTGYGKNGDLNVKFWSTKDPGQVPFSFKIGLGQTLGEKARLTCSPDYAYGRDGFPAWGIMPNSVLIFEIEVLKV
eukprot:gene37401-46143_t